MCPFSAASAAALLEILGKMVPHSQAVCRPEFAMVAWAILSKSDCSSSVSLSLEKVRRSCKEPSSGAFTKVLSRVCRRPVPIVSKSSTISKAMDSCVPPTSTCILALCTWCVPDCNPARPRYSCEYE